MRTIKFRGKRLNNGEWVYGSLTQSETHNKNGEQFMVSYIAPFIPVGSECGFELVKMDRITPTTVGQFTGLTDKNGNEIYEGDIIMINLTDDSTTKSSVVWNNRRGYWGCDIDINHGVQLGLIDKVRIEVVGNIHDNVPERLKGGEQ